MELSIIIPAFNEAQRLPETLEKIQNYFADRPDQVHIMVVDDGSTDSTKQVVSQGVCHFTMLSSPINHGKGAAVRRGMLAATTEWRLICDADLSTPIDELEKFRPHLGHFDIIIGSRRVAGAEVAKRQAWWKVWLGQLGNVIIQLLATPGIKDTQCGFKLFHQRTQPLFAQQQLDGFGFDFEVLWLARQMGWRVKEIPVVWYNDERSKVRFVAYGQTLVELLKIHWYHWRGRYHFV